jgi:integrase
VSSQKALLVPERDVDLAVRAERRREYASHAKADGTWKVYDGHWARFQAFCNAQGFAAGPPTRPDDLADFIVHLREAGKAASSLTVAVAAVAHRNRMAACPSPADHPQVREVLAGARRLAAQAGAGRGKSDPLLPADLRSMVARVDPTKLGGLRDLALLSVGLAGGFRRDELAHLRFEDVRFDSSGMRVTLRRSKTDQEGRGHERRIALGDFVELCPVRNLQAWLAVAGIRSGPIFRPIVHGKVILEKAMSARRVDQIVREYSRAVARENPGALSGKKFSAHSLRSGLCTSAALAGKPEHEIREHVDHRSANTTAKYIRAAGVRTSTVTKGIGL